jgi:hypothetical protein
MSDPEGRRRRLKTSERNEILEAQNYRCLYCDISLDGYVFYRGQERRVKLTWDHMVPYSHTLNNHARNFAATCQFCNSWKSSLIFKSVDEVRLYVAAKWEAQREAERKVPGVQPTIREAEVLAEVLQPQVPISLVEQSPSTASPPIILGSCCIVCGYQFSVPRSNRKYCSPRCSDKARNQ